VRPAYLGTVINAAIIVFALWGGCARRCSRLGAVLAVIAARYVRTFLHLGEPQNADMRAWARYFVIGAGAMGCSWGFSGPRSSPKSILHQFIVIFSGGMAVSAMVILALLRRAFFVCAARCSRGRYGFAQASTMHVFMGLLLVVFLGVLLGAGPMLSDIMLESLRVKFENAALLDQLSEAHSRSSVDNQDLTERFVSQQQTAEELRLASQKLEALVDASPLAIVLRDAEGRIEKWNHAAGVIGWKESGCSAARRRSSRLDTKRKGCGFAG
jgi:PAS domain-containing protein